METKKLTKELKECIKSHLNPYNLGDMGRTTKLINIAIKKLEQFETINPRDIIEFIKTDSKTTRFFKGFISAWYQSIIEPQDGDVLRIINISKDIKDGDLGKVVELPKGVKDEWKSKEDHYIGRVHFKK